MVIVRGRHVLLSYLCLQLPLHSVSFYDPISNFALDNVVSFLSETFVIVTTNIFIKWNIFLMAANSIKLVPTLQLFDSPLEKLSLVEINISKHTCHRRGQLHKKCKLYFL